MNPVNDFHHTLVITFGMQVWKAASLHKKLLLVPLGKTQHTLGTLRPKEAALPVHTATSTSQQTWSEADLIIRLQGPTGRIAILQILWSRNPLALLQTISQPSMRQWGHLQLQLHLSTMKHVKPWLLASTTDLE